MLYELEKDLIFLSILLSFSWYLYFSHYCKIFYSNNRILQDCVHSLLSVIINLPHQYSPLELLKINFYFSSGRTMKEVYSNQLLRKLLLMGFQRLSLSMMVQKIILNMLSNNLSNNIIVKLLLSDFIISSIDDHEQQTKHFLHLLKNTVLHWDVNGV